MQKALMVLLQSPKSITVKADSQLNGYVSYFTHIQKIQNKNNFCVYFKRNLSTSFSKSRSLVFIFDLKRELDSSSFSVLVTKLFHIDGSRIDIRNLLLRSLVFALL